jgi:hypothetical protein
MLIESVHVSSSRSKSYNHSYNNNNLNNSIDKINYIETKNNNKNNR